MRLGPSFATRLLKLEKHRAMRRPPRVVLRFEGPGSERLPQPTEPVDETAKVVVVRFVRTGPAALEAAATGDRG